MKRPAPFRDADEKDEVLFDLRQLLQVGRALQKMRTDPALAAYRLTSIDTAMPLLPTQGEMITAKDVVQRTAECLLHHYNLRRRWDDEELTLTLE